MSVVAVPPDPTLSPSQNVLGSEKEPVSSLESERKEEPDLEKEVDRIQKTAEKQLASVHGLNVSLVKKIRKSEAQSAALLTVNKDLEDKNSDLVSKLKIALSENHSLSVKADQLEESEKRYQEKTSAVVAAELALKSADVALKKAEANLDSVRAERDNFEMEVSRLRMDIKDLHLKLDQANDAIEQERELRKTDVEERSFQISTLSQEKEKEQQSRAELKSQLVESDLKLTEATTSLNKALQERDIALKEAELAREEAEVRLSELKNEAADAISLRDVLTKERDDAVGKRAMLEQEVTNLTIERNRLADGVDMRDRELKRVKDELAESERATDTLETNLGIKTQEATGLVVEVTQLRSARDELETKCEELEILLSEKEKETEIAMVELKNRSETLNQIEGERNLLHSEKSTLTRDFDEARNKSSTLERERADLEKRVYDLEEIKKGLELAVHSLKSQHDDTEAAYEKKLHEKIAEKEKEFEEQIIALREELDAVVNRHAESHRVEKGREEAAAAAAAPTSWADPSVSSDSDQLQVAKGVEVFEPIDATPVPTVDPVPTVVIDEISRTIGPEDTMNVAEIPVEVETEDIGATHDSDWRSLEVPTTMPEAPLPYEGSMSDSEEEMDNGDGTAVMTRTIEDEDDEDDGEFIDDEDSVEGETEPRNMVVSEEVVDEVVVDLPTNLDDVTPMGTTMPSSNMEVEVMPVKTDDGDLFPEGAKAVDVPVQSEPLANTEKIEVGFTPTSTEKTEVTPAVIAPAVISPVAETARGGATMVPPPAKKKAEKGNGILACFCGGGQNSDPN